MMCCLVLGSFASRPSYVGRIKEGDKMTSQDLRVKVAGETLFSKAICRDSFYVTVDRYSVLKLAKEFKHYIEIEKGIIYKRGGFDCEDYAQGLASWVSQAYAMRGYRTPAVGEFHFMYKDKEQGHAVVIGCDKDGMFFVEPQTAQLVKLSYDEKRGCILAKF